MNKPVKLPKRFKVSKGNSDLNQVKVHFDNGYSASVVSHRFSYGGGEGLFELAVLDADRITYDTPITSDVLGCLTTEDVITHLDAINQLPKGIILCHAKHST
jgi:hypothetical protein